MRFEAGFLELEGGLVTDFLFRTCLILYFLVQGLEFFGVMAKKHPDAFRDFRGFLRKPELL
jgi:hypothetical protein